MMRLVLLPGMDGTGKMFTEFTRQFGSDVDITVVSYPVDRVLGYEALVDFVDQRIPRNEPYVLLAESFSGPVAIEFAARRPEGLVGLVLCCTFARNPYPALRLLKGLVDMLPMNARMFARVVPRLFGEWQRAEIISRLSAILTAIAPEVLHARLRSVLEVDMSKRLTQIDMPVMYMQAADDKVMPPSAYAHLKSKLPQTRFVKLHGPHMLLQTLPAEAAKVVREFLVVEIGRDRSAGL
ncbi:MAG: alpha/beta fold hydrolase [Paucimonas sp.]|jgi:pimeloyl-ACP methyl ester carboxylesterase|nr:alpha/beta fold hydrolase [Paucimonas sp.]